MVTVYYTYFDKPLPPRKLEAHIQQLTSALAQKVGKYLKWEDTHRSLFGYLLLSGALKTHTSSEVGLTDLQYTRYGRPYINYPIDFNISHSGEYAVCAISNECKVGVDIEKIQDLELGHFQNNWTEKEWHQMMSSQDPLKSFFDAWTKKEAIIKADGKGLSIPLKEIIIKGESAEIGGATWFLKKINITNDHTLHLAVSDKTTDVALKKIDF